MDACVAFTMEASIGRNRVVVAVLLEHSVKVATSKDSSKEMAKAGICARGASFSPSQTDKPDFCGGTKCVMTKSARYNRMKNISYIPDRENTLVKTPYYLVYNHPIVD